MTAAASPKTYVTSRVCVCVVDPKRLSVGGRRAQDVDLARVMDNAAEFVAGK